MHTTVDEIADGIYRLSTYAPQVAPPAGLTYNVFLILGDEPLLFHTGKRSMFPGLSAAIARLLPQNACAGSRSATTSRTNAAR
jgi:flavorubredoxin